MSGKVRACYGEWDCDVPCKHKKDCRRAWLDNRDDYTAILVLGETDCPEPGWDHWTAACATCEHREPCLARRVMRR